MTFLSGADRMHDASDFHVHSTAFDGQYAPTELVGMAQPFLAWRAVSVRLCGWNLSAAKLGGKFENIAILAAIEVNEARYLGGFKRCRGIQRAGRRLGRTVGAGCGWGRHHDAYGHR